MWLVVLIGGTAGLLAFADGQITAFTIVAFILLLVVAWWMSPWFNGRSKTHAQIMALPPEERRGIVYWRPGCIFCQRLRGGLGKDVKSVHWVNIWQDPEAAAFVRSVNGGNETVPTVVIDGVPHTNPDPRDVRDAINPRP